MSKEVTAGFHIATEGDGVQTGVNELVQQTTDALVKAGLRGILNFSPCYIAVPKNVKVINIDIAMDLVRLPYYIPDIPAG